jgi:hypothetical protein
MTGAGLAQQGLTDRISAATQLSDLQKRQRDSEEDSMLRRMFMGPQGPQGSLGDVAAGTGGIAATADAAAATGNITASSPMPGSAPILPPSGLSDGSAPLDPRPMMPQAQPTAAPPAPAAAAPAAAPTGPSLPREYLQRYQENEQRMRQLAPMLHNPKAKAHYDRMRDENQKMVPAGVLVRRDGTLDATGLRIAQEARRAETPMTAADRKAMDDADKEILKLMGVTERLDKVEKIAPNTLSGWFTGARGQAARNLPDWMVPDFLASPKEGNAQWDWSRLMNAEAIKAMSDQLTGASTNFEMEKFIEIIADPTAPPDKKLEAVRELNAEARRQLQYARERSDGLRDQSIRKPGGQPSVIRPGSTTGAPSGGDRPPVAGAERAPDGNWYVRQGDKYFRVEQ